MTYDKFMDMFSVDHALEWMLLLLIGGIIYILIRLHFSKNTAFNLEDLIVINGKLDEKKFTRLGAWLISTWGYIYLLMKGAGSIPEWYFVGYMGVWVSNAIVEKYVSGGQRTTADPGLSMLQPDPTQISQNIAQVPQPDIQQPTIQQPVVQSPVVDSVTTSTVSVTTHRRPLNIVRIP